MTLYNFLYVDLEKIVSLYSQIIGGIVERREVSKDTAYSADNKRHYDFKIFKHDAGGTQDDRSGMKETVKPHHSVLIELEQSLMEQGYMIDLTTEPTASLRNPEVRDNIRKSLCLKVSGRAVIEDYERIRSIASAFPEVIKLINRSVENSITSSPDYLKLQKVISDVEQAIRQTKDRNQREGKKEKLAQAKKQLTASLAAANPLESPEEWILDGLQTWINVFLPGIINLRIYGSEKHDDEHVFGHLKRSNFEDADSSSFHFTYGSKPTEPLTMIGLITSVPAEGEDSFTPLSEFDDRELLAEESVERAFRGLFRGFDNFESMIRTIRFPRVLVHPLMVYRSVESTKKVN